MPAEVWAAVIAELVDELDALLGVVPESGCESPAASVEWTCWRTAEHIAGDIAHYAAQIIGQPRDHYVKFGFDTSRASMPDELREVVRVAGACSPQRCGRPDQTASAGIRMASSPRRLCRNRRCRGHRPWP
jgi:hypothetical protein